MMLVCFIFISASQHAAITPILTCFWMTPVCTCILAQSWVSAGRNLFLPDMWFKPV